MRTPHREAPGSLLHCCSTAKLEKNSHASVVNSHKRRGSCMMMQLIAVGENEDNMECWFCKWKKKKGFNQKHYSRSGAEWVASCQMLTLSGLWLVAVATLWHFRPRCQNMEAFCVWLENTMICSNAFISPYICCCSRFHVTGVSDGCSDRLQMDSWKWLLS